MQKWTGYLLSLAITFEVGFVQTRLDARDSPAPDIASKNRDGDLTRPLNQADDSSLSQPVPVLQQDVKTRPKRVLLLGQRADSHPRTTHEYMAGVRLMSRLLQNHGNLQVIVVQADNPWSDGPEQIEGADGVVLYLTEGAKWVSDDKVRLAAFQRLAQKGGALCGLHWGVGTKEAPPIENFLALFGCCHGGPDRKYKFGQFELAPTSERHPITSGIARFSVHDEFYYALKTPERITGLTMLMNAQGNEVDHPVAWAWERPDSGRSFGFTGMHFHENWNKLEYRRLIVQGVLWSLHESIPENGLELNITENDLALPQEKGDCSSDRDGSK